MSYARIHRERGGTYQVRVYGGVDPLTGTDIYLTGSSRDGRRAEKIRTELLTGARRGEIAALRWFDLHLETGVLEIRRAYGRRAGKAVEKGTKTHQMRRVSLDLAAVRLLTEHMDGCQERVKWSCRRCHQAKNGPSPGPYLPHRSVRSAG